ncbi:MAG: signal peptidase I [Parachlamydiales bacterium]|nr:signal peptidase I [Parachlamydiales bacterium]
MIFKNNTYSIHKCKKILHHVHRRYKKKKKSLTSIQQKRFENILLSLQTAILKKDKVAADRGAKNLEKLVSIHLKKSLFEQIFDGMFAIVFAIIFAIIVRQTWFELYTIPTGSMRPTLKEKDFLIVSKTDFGINIPLMQKHLYFNKDLLKRGSIVTFSSANMDIADANMMYFYVFPGKKQLVKRLVGKPGDVLYFYGGKIYGIDSNSNPIKDFDDVWFEKIEHIPFITFEGKVDNSTKSFDNVYSPVIFYQMNEPIAMLNINQFGSIQSELVTDQSNVFTKEAEIKDYGDIWGFQNFAMARILSCNEASKFASKDLQDIKNANYYLELTHHPSIKNAKIITDEMGRLRPALGYSTSLIVLNEDSLKTIFSNLYTARFCVKNGYAYRYGSPYKTGSFLPKIKNVEDGCYEFENGIAYKVNFLGITKKLNKDHPLNQFSEEKTKLLFNLGIEFNNYFSPIRKNQTLIPHRYAYFRNKDLYLMGHTIFKKEDPALTNFLQREYKRQSSATSSNLYHPFEDLGPPINENGKLDIEFIKKYGLKIPKNMYLALGDNHAMSADSRDFGFVYQGNLKGGVNFLFWPPSQRFGKPFQPPYQPISLPKVIIWSIAGIVLIVAVVYLRRRTRKKLKF